MSTSGGSAGAGAVLAAVSQDPGVAATPTVNTLAYAALDTVNLRATFTAPQSGRVVVAFGCFGRTAGAVGGSVGVIEGAAVVAVAQSYITGVPNLVSGLISGAKLITGLVPGSIHNYDLAIASNTAGQAFDAAYGGGETPAGFGAAYVTVSAA